MPIINKCSAKTLLFALVFVTALLSSCDNDDVNSNARRDEVITLLVGKTWKVQSVIAAGVDRTSVYTDFELMFERLDEGRIKTVTKNGEPVWPVTTTFNCFYEGLLRLNSESGELSEVVVKYVNGNELELELEWFSTTIGGGRGKSTPGTHVFKFSN